MTDFFLQIGLSNACFSLALAHELAHVRRRDHLVRWLEWLACVCFWWNPVVWWAQRNLRATEEICCDDLVISCLNPKPEFYANSLLSAVEFIARPVFRPPAMASEINSGGFLERRFKMIVSNSSKLTNCRWVQICVLLCAVVVLPLRIASAADHEAVGKRLRAAVAAGELTADEARIMLGALRRGVQAERGERGERERGERSITVEEYRRAEVKMRKMVEDGKAKPEDVERRLIEMRKMMAERGERERGEGSVTLDEYRRAEAKMRKMIEDGKAKPEDVERRLIEMRKMMGERGEWSRRGERRLSREDYGRAMAELKKAVAEGKITGEQAKARLEGMRRMIGGQADRERDIDWEAIKRRIEAGVKSGRITRKEADAQYEAIKKRMGGDSKRIGRDDYSQAAREIREAVAAGKLTKEQGREKLAAIRKQIGEKKEGDVRKKSREGEAKKDVDWEGIKKRIESAVKSGKMTREQADAKYKEIREQMAGRGERDSKRISREDFANAAGKIREAIASGKITEEQGRAKLAAMRVMIAEKSEDAARKGTDWEGIKKRIEGAVKSGKMTREQADAKYKEIKERMAGRRER